MGGALEDWVEKMNGLRSANWQVQNSHSTDIKHSIGNIVNNIVINMHDDRWVIGLYIFYLFQKFR